MSHEPFLHHSNSDSLNAAHAEADTETAYSALRSLAELLLVCDDDETINSHNLSSLVTVIADRIEPVENQRN